MPIAAHFTLAAKHQPVCQRSTCFSIPRPSSWNPQHYPTFTPAPPPPRIINFKKAVGIDNLPFRHHCSPFQIVCTTHTIPVAACKRTSTCSACCLAKTSLNPAPFAQFFTLLFLRSPTTDSFLTLALVVIRTLFGRLAYTLAPHSLPPATCYIARSSLGSHGLRYWVLCFLLAPVYKE